jgi:hypothetical protein
MKTQVIQIEPHDDVISTRDKMTWAKSQRILLIWPGASDVFGRSIDLVLLQRYSQQVGSQLGLVTRDTILKARAIELGLPVFGSVEDGNRLPWRRQRRRKRPAQNTDRNQRLLRRGQMEAFHEQVREERVNLQQLSLPYIRIPAFVVGVAGFLALVLFFLPSAQIQIKPAIQEQSVSLIIRTSPDIQAVNISGGIPARIIQIEIEGEDQIESSGSLTIPDQTASGKVTFSNLSDKPVDVPAGTVVSTLGEDPARFVTLQSLSIPAGPKSSADVAVRAAKAGTNGNVGAGKVTGIEGLIGVQLTVSNEEPIAGGTDRISRMPDPSDYDILKGRLMKSLGDGALLKFKEQVSTGQRFLEITVKEKTILSEDREPAEDLPGDRLTLKIRAEYQAWIISEADIRTVVQTAMQANLPNGYQPVGTDFKISDLSNPILKNSFVTWEIIGLRQIQAFSSRDGLAQGVAGKKTSEAAAWIQKTLDLQNPPAISVFPEWWPRLPYLPFRISVVTE